HQRMVQSAAATTGLAEERPAGTKDEGKLGSAARATNRVDGGVAAQAIAVQFIVNRGTDRMIGEQAPFLFRRGGRVIRAVVHWQGRHMPVDHDRITHGGRRGDDLLVRRLLAPRGAATRPKKRGKQAKANKAGATSHWRTSRVGGRAYGLYRHKEKGQL